MKIIESYVEPTVSIPPESLYRLVELMGRTCYLSEKTEGDSTESFIKRLMSRNHWSVLEHAHISLRFVCDRGVTHELVRHRIASYSQESTRYCNYYSGKFGKEIKVIDPATGFQYDLNNSRDRAKYEEWVAAMGDAERHYMKLMELGATPQEARSVLPTSTKTEIGVTMNVRQWRHFLKMRWVGVAGAPHPQMVEIAGKAYDLLVSTYPVFFEDIKKPK